MTCALLLTVHFHEPRYHGAGQWPPSPMRLFQALVAGAADGAHLPEDARAALEWLERLQPPEIVAPPAVLGQRYINYVPNNDADAGKNPIEAPRSGKTIHPWIFETEAPIHYLWKPIEDGPHARRLCVLTERLHHFGRGVDPAWAAAQILPEKEARTEISGQGIHHLPSGPAITKQAVPIAGTLRSLERRFALNRKKFNRLNGKLAFSQPPKPLMREVSYDAPPDRVLYELRDETRGFLRVPSREAITLTKTLLNGAAERLKQEFPDRAETFERLVIGRGADAADKTRRMRLVPLPSIGTEYVDRTIRRLLVEIPQDCPIRRDTLLWAFDGLTWHNLDGVVLGSLVRANDRQMLENYERSSTLWQTETPVALGAGRRRIGKGDTKAGVERLAEEDRAIAEVRQALRHANIAQQPTGIEVQREPFSTRGAPCNDVTSGRFDKHALWHVRMSFEQPVAGPLVIGNGRFAGLGVMSPVDATPDVLAFRIVAGLEPRANAETIALALRRAAMARVQALLGLRERESLPGWFTGHETEGGPLRGGNHTHLAFLADLARDRVLIVPPHCFDRRTKREPHYMRMLADAMRGFSVLRAGKAGVLELRADAVDADDPLLGRSRVWESITPYAATRHPRRESVDAALITDALRELNRRNLPRAQVEVTEILEPFGKPLARLRLRFVTAHAGPILLGRTLHKGGGLFEMAPYENE